MSYLSIESNGCIYIIINIVLSSERKCSAGMQHKDRMTT